MDAVAALLEAAFAFEEPTQGRVSLEVDEASVRDAAEARWQVLMGGTAGDSAEHEAPAPDSPTDLPGALFASEREFRAFCADAIPLGTSEPFLKTAASTRWEMAFGTPSSPAGGGSGHGADGDALLDLLGSALLEDRLLHEVVDLKVDEHAVAAAADARWQALELPDSEEVSTDLDRMNLRKLLGGHRAVANFLRARIPLDSSGLAEERVLRESADERWSQAGLPVPAHVPQPRPPRDLRSKSESFRRYFGKGARVPSGKREGILREFGMANEKMDTRVIYVLLSADWQPEEIHDEDAREHSFDAIRRHPFREIMESIFGWLVDDSIRYPGKEEFQFAIVGTNPEQDTRIPSRRQRLRLKRDRADVFLVHLPKSPTGPGPEIDLEVGISQGRQNMFVMSEAEESDLLGLPRNLVIRIMDRSFFSGELARALDLARDIAHLPSAEISEFLSRTREGDRPQQLGAWLALLYLYIRDLACRRDMIDAQAIAIESAPRFIESGSSKSSRAGDPVLAAVIRKARGLDLPPSLDRKERRSEAWKVSAVMDVLHTA